MMPGAARRRGLRAWWHRRGWEGAVVGLPFLWLAAFVLLPFLIVLLMSVATRTPTAPPFGWGGANPLVSLEGYGRLVTDDLYGRAFLNSLGLASVATVLCLLLGYPMALALARQPAERRTLLLMLVILPFWTSFLLRVYAWMSLMGTSSWFNRALTGAWNWATPWDLRALPLMHSSLAVVLVTAYTYLPFMVLPLYANLERLDPALDEAAMDLGSRPLRVFWDVTLPQSWPGIVAGGLLVFIPAAGELVIPTLVGDAGTPMIGRLIADEFTQGRDWPMAAAAAVALVVVMVAPTVLYSRLQARAERGRP